MSPNPLTYVKVEKKRSAKITQEIAEAMRRRVAGGESQKDVADHFNVTATCVWSVVNNKVWKS